MSRLQRWDAPADFAYPPSDPAPKAAPSTAAQWPKREWRERAQELLAQNMTGHLTLIDDEGYPLPIRTRSAELIADGLRLAVPKGAPWRTQGKASLCFAGVATFIGDVSADARGTHFTVERMLPDLPLVLDPREIWTPSDSIRKLVTDAAGAGARASRPAAARESRRNRRRRRPARSPARSSWHACSRKWLRVMSRCRPRRESHHECQQAGRLGTR